jgi:GH25 family lysozyme M1 (1,4-beta-N-acetylmuramidase)
MTPPQSKNKHSFKKKRFTKPRRAGLLSATTALSVAVAGILIAPPASASPDAPDPVPSVAPVPTTQGEPTEVPARILEAPVEAALPAPEDSGSMEPTEPPTPVVETEQPSAEPTPDPTTGAAEPAEAKSDAATVEDIPLDEMTEEQKLALLKELQGENGAAMGKGLELREEREAELTTVEGQEELAETLDVLEIDRTAAVSIAASNRNHWRAPGVQGMDVSGWQPYVNWQTEWNLGARFAYVKATESTTYRNPQFGSQYTGSYNVGMIRGAYHFAIPTANLQSARDQARYFVANGGGWSGDGKTLPPLLDIEFNPYPQLGNTCYNLSPSQMVNWVLEFSKTMKSLTGRVPAIYTNGSWWNGCTNYSTALKNHPLHVAHFSTGNVTSPWLPAGWNRFDIWQYSESGPFLGDSNVWRGSLTQLKEFATYPSGVKPAAPKPKPISTSVTTAAPGDLNMDGNADLVSRRIDGSLWFYPGNGRGGYNNPSRIGGGWQIYSKLIGAGNYNGDKYPDLLARHTDGTLWFYAGTGNGKFKSRVEVGTSGWNQFRSIINAGDLNGDGKRDLIAARRDGLTYLYPGRGNGRSSTDWLPAMTSPATVKPTSWLRRNRERFGCWKAPEAGPA